MRRWISHDGVPMRGRFRLSNVPSDLWHVASTLPGVLRIAVITYARTLWFVLVGDWVTVGKELDVMRLVHIALLMKWTLLKITGIRGEPDPDATPGGP